MNPDDELPGPGYYDSQTYNSIGKEARKYTLKSRVPIPEGILQIIHLLF
jgi:hypothetical protein